MWRYFYVDGCYERWIPSWTRVPYPVGVKKAGIPAPPALMRSARVPCGVSSSRISPDKYCRSNSAFSPTYDAITWLIWRCFSKSPKPKVSTPQLLETTVRSLTLDASRPAIKFSGMPHRPKPENESERNGYRVCWWFVAVYSTSDQ